MIPVCFTRAHSESHPEVNDVGNARQLHPSKMFVVFIVCEYKSIKKNQLPELFLTHGLWKSRLLVDRRAWYCFESPERLWVSVLATLTKDYTTDSTHTR